MARAVLMRNTHDAGRQAQRSGAQRVRSATPRAPSHTMSERKAVIKNADMSEDMQQDAIDCSTQVRGASPCAARQLCFSVAQWTMRRCGAARPAAAVGRSAWAGQAASAARMCRAARRVRAAPDATGWRGLGGNVALRGLRRPLWGCWGRRRASRHRWWRGCAPAVGLAGRLRRYGPGRQVAGRGSLLRPRRAGTSAGRLHRRPAATGPRRRLLPAAGAGAAWRPRVKAPTPSHRPAAVPRRCRSDGPVCSVLRLSAPPRPRCAPCGGELTPLPGGLPLLSSHSRRRWRSTTSRRTLPPSSRRSSTRSTAPPGTASWAATSVRGQLARARATPALTSARRRLVRDARDQALHLLLPGAGSSSPIQVGLSVRTLGEQTLRSGDSGAGRGAPRAQTRRARDKAARGHPKNRK